MRYGTSPENSELRFDALFKQLHHMYG